MNKKELRKLYTDKRNNLSEKEVLIFDDLLLIQFQKLTFNHPKILLSYFPIENKNEPNTPLFTQYLKYSIDDLSIAYPVSNFTNNTMKAFLIDEETEFKKNKFEIFEPISNNEISVNDINIIFVPLIAFDEDGFRIGYGKGFYDKYLENHSPKIIKIGFSYFEPVSKIEDRNSFDVPLDYCITPHKIYEFE